MFNNEWICEDKDKKSIISKNIVVNEESREHNTNLWKTKNVLNWKVQNILDIGLNNILLAYVCVFIFGYMTWEHNFY